MSGCVKKLKRAIWIVCVVIGTTAPLEGADVTLNWNSNPEPDIVGYTLSYGTESGAYTISVDVGNTTSHTVTNLFMGQPYYFALQAYNTAGISPYSNEVSATLTSPLTVINLTANRTSPQPANTTITFSAIASGGTPPYQYKWWIATGTTQTVGSNWSANSSFAWTPTAANPSYTIRVWARNGSSTADAPDNPAAILEMNFAITSSAANTAPTVDAGANRSITLPSNTTLTATVADDGQPIPPGALTLSWIRISGPGTVTFSAPTAATTTASFSAAGAYELRLTASDGALSTSDDVTVTVAAAANTTPTVNAGADQTITLPSTAALSATVSDDGQPAPPGVVTLTWTRVSGPGTVAFSAPSAAATTATFSASGPYVLRLTASDSVLSTTDDVTVTVNPAANTAPTVNAGANRSITLPSSTTFTATVADDGQPIPPGALTLSWTRVSGPGTVTFSAPTAATTTASFSAAGAYELRLTASDGALSGSDDVAITVNSPPVSGGLVGAWGFDEGAGVALGDSSGNGGTGAVSGATWTTGKYGQALSFDGINDVVTLSDLDLNGSFTIMAWMQTRSLHANGCVSLVMKAVDYGFEICEGRLYAGVGTGSNWTAYPSVPLANADLNVWKHVTLSYDGATVRFYIGGALVRSQAGTHRSGNQLLRFGRWTSNGKFWNGLIDEIRIYGRALSQAEVQVDMNTPIGN